MDEELAGLAEKIVQEIDGPHPRKDSPGGILPRGHEGAVPLGVGLRGKRGISPEHVPLAVQVREPGQGGRGTGGEQGSVWFLWR